MRDVLCELAHWFSPRLLFLPCAFLAYWNSFSTGSEFQLYLLLLVMTSVLSLAFLPLCSHSSTFSALKEVNKVVDIWLAKSFKFPQSSTAMQQVLDNLKDLPSGTGAKDIDLIFLRGIMESPIVRSLAKVSCALTDATYLLYRNSCKHRHTCM